MTPGADTLKTNMTFFKLGIDILYDPVFPLPRHISKVCILYFIDLNGCTIIAAVFKTELRNINWLECTSVNEWKIKNEVFIYYGIILFGSSNRNHQRHRLTSPIKVGTGSKNNDWGIPDPERSFSPT